jgi:parallel beta-helix repeat protein
MLCLLERGGDAVSSGKLGVRLTLGAIMALVTLLSMACGSSGSHNASGHLYVSARGSDGAGCTHAHPCRSITHAVAVAHAGEEIDVGPGSYAGQVVLTKRLTIKGSHSPVVNAHGHGRGVLIQGAPAAGSVVQGLVVENATYEGILALGTTRVTIAHDVVRDNDRGFFVGHPVAENASYVLSHRAKRVFAEDVLPANAHTSFVHRFTGECKPNGPPPKVHSVDLRFVDERAGGCGESIHLASTSDSRVVDNLVVDNIGGIYLTDEEGPAAHNLIAGNTVRDNLYDCGITLASHSHRAATPKGRPRPRAGGVYDNTIRGNVAGHNGVRVPGAGILVAAAFPGGAAYGNRIIGNTVNDNGLPGVALHSHSLYQDLNGNVIRDNVVGRNALGGSHGGPGDGDAGIHQTAGILVWSWRTRITRIDVSGNHIGENYFGIWTKNTPRLSRAANQFRNVTVHLSQH